MNSGVGCHALLKGIFLTHWLNLCLFYFLSPLGFFCSTTCEAPKPALLLLLLSLWSCLTLCDPIDGSPSGFPVPGILQARTLEWVVISLSNAWKWKVKVKSLSCVRLLTTPWLQPTRLLCPWDFPGKSTGVSYHCLLQKLAVVRHKCWI